MTVRMFEGGSLAAKMLAIGLVVLGLMIPLSLLRGLIAERSQMRSQAVDTVAKGWGGSLTVGGAMLRVPFDVLVLSENYALLIGAIALFAVLATIMIATRKLRWDAGGMTAP